MVDVVPLMPPRKFSGRISNPVVGSSEIDVTKKGSRKHFWRVKGRVVEQGYFLDA